jgi:hypothetical protein
MKRSIAALALLVAAAAMAGTTNNDDSCDIAWQPAATLLLPYFQVDFNSPPQSASQTLFTIQNVSALPQIARVTLWTDWAFPAYSFPVFLTGYDVQPYNLYDLFANGTVVSTSVDTPIPVNPTFGSQPASNSANPNFLPDVQSGCRDVPAALPPAFIDELRRIFTLGTTSAGCRVGATHTDAIGYITIDLVATCAPKNATSPDYFSILLYDNVLTGDYEQLAQVGGNHYAQGSPLVHIRAIPEGGPAGAVAATNLPYTFYDRFTAGQPSRTIDRRQPLPSVFAPRFIAGGPGGLNTMLKIWREGVTTSNATCSDYKNNELPFAEIVRFDEHENATITSSGCGLGFCPGPPAAPLTMAISTVLSGFLPPLSTSGDAGGWLYLNLDNGGSANYSTARTGYGQRGRASQGWVITSMFAGPTYAIETTAIALGNGCTPRAPLSSQPGAPIGPAPNPTP